MYVYRVQKMKAMNYIGIAIMIIVIELTISEIVPKNNRLKNPIIVLKMQGVLSFSSNTFIFF